MPQIVMPPEAGDLIIGAESHLVHPTQVTLESPWTNNRLVLDRGYPRWEGMLQLDVAEGPDDARRVEAWLDAFHGHANHCEIPLLRPTPPPAFRADVVSTTITAAGHLTHLVDRDVPDLGVGMRVRAGMRVFIVRAIDARTLTLDPQRALAANTQIGRASTVRAFAQVTDAPTSPRSSDYWGPWIFNWRE